MRNWILKILHFCSRPTRSVDRKKVADFYREPERVLTNKTILNKNIYYVRTALELAHKTIVSYRVRQLSHVIGRIWKQFSKTY